MPFFNNFFLDGIVFLGGFALVVGAAYLVYVGGAILYALVRGAWDTLFRHSRG